MLTNYLKITFRSIKRHKGFSSINIAGLAIGMAVSILIFLWVQDELSFDSFHDDSHRIYRVAVEVGGTGMGRTFSCVGPPVGPALKQDYPQVEAAVRFLVNRNIVVIPLDTPDRSPIYVDIAPFAESAVPEFFGYKFIKGNRETALDDPSAVVISRSLSETLFKDGAPMGKLLKVNTFEYHVTGVFEDLPANTHMDTDVLLSWGKLKDWPYLTSWPYNIMHTYIKVKEGVDVESFQEHVKNIADHYAGEFLEQAGIELNYFLQPITSIHLGSRLENEVGNQGSRINIYIFISIAFFVLLIAGLNFVNLSTAQYHTKAKEVVVRKVNGALRRQVAMQFLGESLAISFISIVLALFLVATALDGLNLYLGKTMSLAVLLQPSNLLVVLGIWLLVGISAGIYPAFVLSSFHPVAVLKGSFEKDRSKGLLRKVMVTLQFAISIFLVIGTMALFMQVQFMKGRHLGFDSGNLLVTPVRSFSVNRGLKELRNRLLGLPGVVSVTGSGGVPGKIVEIFEVSRKDKPDKRLLGFYCIFTDYHFTGTYKLRFAAGGPFQEEKPAGREEGVLINEAGAAALGFARPEDALGKLLFMRYGTGKVRTVTGVVKDFNFKSLESRVEPLLIGIDPTIFRSLYISIRLDGKNVSDTLAAITKVWQEQFPKLPFDYRFIDKSFNEQYRPRQRIGGLLLAFTAIAIFVACLGLLGLSSFAAQQRTKEIGIRKVLGASVAEIILLLSREFAGWILLANLLAWPLAYLAVNKWLESFAYRATPGIGTFMIAGVTALVIALLTAGFHSVKAALSNPVEALRYE